MFVLKGVRVAGPPLCSAFLWLGVVLVLKEDNPRNQQGTTAQNGRPWPEAQRRLLTDEARQRGNGATPTNWLNWPVRGPTRLSEPH